MDNYESFKQVQIKLLMSKSVEATLRQRDSEEPMPNPLTMWCQSLTDSHQLHIFAAKRHRESDLLKHDERVWSRWELSRGEARSFHPGVKQQGDFGGYLLAAKAYGFDEWIFPEDLIEIDNDE